MAANPLTTRRDEWTPKRYAYEVAKTRRPTREEQQRTRKQILALILISLGIAFTLWAFADAERINSAAETEFNRVMQLTAHWVQQPPTAGR